MITMQQKQEAREEVILLESVWMKGSFFFFFFFVKSMFLNFESTLSVDFLRSWQFLKR
jgi:hypothetical protein